MRFEKYEGLGNDFVLVHADECPAMDAAKAIALCDRHRGVGADGVLFVSPLPAGEPFVSKLTIFNADGSVPEMCGNGLRCVALAWARRTGQHLFVVDTDAGPRACDVKGDLVRVDMGRVVSEGDVELAVTNRSLCATCMNTGNPHAVLFGAWSRADAKTLGPAIEKHSIFPRGANVEFATPEADAIDVIVWERGVGLTLACGTGAVAVAAAACLRGLRRYDEPIAVRLPGGVLRVMVAADTHRATMEGPARHVFSGHWP